MDLRSQKEVKEMNKIRNTSTEILYGLRNRHFLQPNVLCAICRSNTEMKQVVPISRRNSQCTNINITDESKKRSICSMAEKKENLSAKIKLMTGEQMGILNNNSFNQEVEGLKRRVGQVECTKTHKKILKTSLQKVFKLEKEVSAILALQEETSPTGAVPWVGDADTDTPMDIHACLETAG